MKAMLGKFRPTRKIAVILAGCFLLSGASAAFTVYFGEGILFGPHKAGPSGIACTDIQVVDLQRNGQRWVRKFVRTSGADGVARVRTALRIASVFSKQEEADLYQVVVIDENGPDTRGAMRGRAIGADVLFTPFPGEVEGMDVPFKARYVDGPANTVGLFSGDRINLSFDEVKTAILAIDDHEGCIDPLAEEATVAESGGHGSSGGSEAAEESPMHHAAVASGRRTMEEFAAAGDTAAHEGGASPPGIDAQATASTTETGSDAHSEPEHPAAGTH